MYWKLDSVLQLQRMAFEEAGLGSWERCAHEVPVTNEKIQVATEWDDWHPSIRGKEVVLAQPSPSDISKQSRSSSSETLNQAATTTSASPKRQASVTELETVPTLEHALDAISTADGVLGDKNSIHNDFRANAK